MYQICISLKSIEFLSKITILYKHPNLWNSMILTNKPNCYSRFAGITSCSLRFPTFGRSLLSPLSTFQHRHLCRINMNCLSGCQNTTILDGHDNVTGLVLWLLPMRLPPHRHRWIAFLTTYRTTPIALRHRNNPEICIQRWFEIRLTSGLHERRCVRRNLK